MKPERTPMFLKLTNTRQLLEADNVDLSRSTFNNVNLSGATFTDINLSASTLDNINLSDLKITHANLKGVSITDCSHTAEMTIDGVTVADLFAAYRTAQK